MVRICGGRYGLDRSPEVTRFVYRRSISLLTSLLLLVSLAPSAVLASDPVPDGSIVSSTGRILPPLPAGVDSSSIHAEMLADEGARTFAFEPGGEPTIVLDRSGDPAYAADVGVGGIAPAPLAAADAIRNSGSSALPNGLRKEVFGFLPYWMLNGSALDDLNYALVSTIAYFSVGANKNGSLAVGTTSTPSTGWAGWRSSQMTEVLDRAHASGVRVVLTVTMMAWDSTSAANQATLLTSSTNRNRLVSQIVAAVKDRGADGVNLDFEPLATSLRDPYVAFVRQLKSALTAAGGGDYLTVSVMASAATWATGYDVPGLSADGAADALFVMGYDYHWSGSARAGGVAPIESPYTIDVNGTMLDFLAETSGAKLIWGVPYYGRTWPTSSKALNATTLGGGSKAYYYTGSHSQAGTYGRLWDDVGQVPWYRYWDGVAGNWVEGYYDDTQSLGAKYDLINARGLAGTGMWTLLMDQGRDELWRLLADRFVDDTAPPVGGIGLLPASVDGQAINVTWRAIDYASGIASYSVEVRRDEGAWSAWLTRTTATSAIFMGVPGSTYQFRLQAVDRLGNAQPWTDLPGTPSSLSPGSFATVTASSLNVRSGPGTSYGIVTTASAGNLAYVLGGPTTADGYSWYRVQYAFTEWPSADYPRIGWMAAGSGATTFLAPAPAPTQTTFTPVVTWLGASPLFSPNGDGRLDSATVSYSLEAPADAVTLEVVDARGARVRSEPLGSQSTGPHDATWDGQDDAGSWVAEGTYLMRVVVLIGGEAHVSPTAASDAAIMSRFGTRADTTAPTVIASTPAEGAELVSGGASVVLDFSEPVRWTGGRNLQLQLENGTQLPTDNVQQRRNRRVVVRPRDPLPGNTTMRVWVSSGISDLAGNRASPILWTYKTAPGAGYVPGRRATLRGGSHIGYLIGSGGSLSSPRALSTPSATHPTVDHRGALPNLPGRWFRLASGALAGRWVRESFMAYLRGSTESQALSTTLVIRAGTHIGYRFDRTGRRWASKTATISAKGTATCNRRTIINGLPYVRATSGPWAGYWLPESGQVYIPGRVMSMGLPSLPRLDFAPGTYTGYAYTKSGSIQGSRTYNLPRGSGASADAWAIINGQPHYRIHDGIWAGLWIVESAGVTLHA